MLIKFLVNLFFVFVVFLLNLTFFQSINPYFGKINLLLVVLIFVTALFKYEEAVTWTVMICILSEIYSFLPFGFLTILFFLSFLFIYFLFSNVFTDRSFYSFLVTTILATLFYEFLFRTMIYFWQGIPFLFIKEFWIFSVNIVISNLIVVVLFFYIINFLFNKFNSIFIKV